MVQGVGFDGLASGLETDEIIQQLMEIEMQSVNRYQEDKEEVEAEKEIWQDINQQLTGFDNALTDLQEADTFDAMTASSQNEDVMSVTADTDAVARSYTVNEVEQLAQAYTARTDEPVADPHEELGLEGEFSISYANEGEEEGEIVVDVDSEDNLYAISSAINDEAGVANAYVAGNDLVIQSEETGEDYELEFEDLGGQDNVLEELNIIDGDENVLDSDEGQDAVFTMDNVEITSSDNTGIEEVEGLAIDLHGTTAPDEQFNVDVAHDSESVVGAIEEFVENYNEVQTYLSDISDEEEDLQGDVTVRRLQNALRHAAMDPVAGVDEFDSLADIGIEIDRDAEDIGEMLGVMSVDESELDKALTDNPEAVRDLFTLDEDDSQGAAHRLSDRIEGHIRAGGTIENREESLSREIDRIDDRIQREERNMENREERLRERFARMEVALYESQQQLQEVMGMTQQLGGTSLSDMMM